jgi:hypothetical protein
MPEQPTLAAAGWPALPTETEIYILPNGEIIVADLPQELAVRLAHLLAPPPLDAPTNSTVATASSTEHVTHQ